MKHEININFSVVTLISFSSHAYCGEHVFFDFLKQTQKNQGKSQTL